MTGAKTKIIFDQMESSLHKTKGSQGKILNVRNKNDGMRNIFFSDYKNITDLEFQDSRHSNFLQIADICAYNVHRQFQMCGRHWIKNPEKGKGLPSYEFFDRIAHNFYCNSRGRVSGIGIKLFPVPTDKWRIPIGTKTPARERGAFEDSPEWYQHTLRGCLGRLTNRPSIKMTYF